MGSHLPPVPGKADGRKTGERRPLREGGWGELFGGLRAGGFGILTCSPRCSRSRPEPRPLLGLNSFSVSLLLSPFPQPNRVTVTRTHSAEVWTASCKSYARVTKSDVSAGTRRCRAETGSSPGIAQARLLRSVASLLLCRVFSVHVPVDPSRQRVLGDRSPADSSLQPGCRWRAMGGGGPLLGPPVPAKWAALGSAHLEV